MRNALRIGVVFGLALTAINGSLELLPATFGNLVGILSLAAWILCVGLAGARTRRRHPEASAALTAIVVVAVDSARSTLVKIVSGTSGMMPDSAGSLQPVHMTPGMIVLVNLLIFLALVPLAAGIGSLGGRLAGIRSRTTVGPTIAEM